MLAKIQKPTVGRIMIAIACSFFFLKLPGLMAVHWKWLVVLLILSFFLVFPEKKGVPCGLVAGFFSLAFAGLGQIYVREYGRGFVFLLIAVFAYMTTGYSGKSFILNNVLFVISAIDAFSIGKRGIGII